MSGLSVGFDPTIPGNDDDAALGPAAIRSFKTAMQTAMSAEHAFPPSGGSQVGAHLLGSARVFVGPASQVSSADTTGRMMVTSDTSQLWYVGSDASYVVGGLGTTFLKSYPSAGLSGTGLSFSLYTTVTASATGPTVTYATAFSDTPVVFASLATVNTGSPTIDSATVNCVVSTLFKSVIPKLWNGNGSAYTGGAVQVNLLFVGKGI